MSYIVVSKFADLEDNKRLYDVGDSFPCEGRTVSEKRIAELASSKNKVGKPLIKKVENKNDDDGVVPEPAELVRQESKKMARKVRNTKRSN